MIAFILTEDVVIKYWTTDPMVALGWCLEAAERSVTRVDEVPFMQAVGLKELTEESSS